MFPCSADQDTPVTRPAWLGPRRSLPRACPEREPEPRTPLFSRGFSLLELIVSLGILLLITGAIFSLMAGHQKVAQTEHLKDDMYQGLRGAVELLTQEIGQAGLVSLPGNPPPTLSAAVLASPMGQTVAVSSAASMFVGEKLLIDSGSLEEVVTVTAVSTGPAQITAIFAAPHAPGAAIQALGVFPNGVMTSSTPAQLRIFGDIRADGSLVYVRYDCTPAAGTLTRSITTIMPWTTLADDPDVLLTNLIPNPAGAPCFQITTASAGTYTFVTNVAITLSVQTSVPDPQTGINLTLTKSLRNLAPRNLLIGLELANVSRTVRLQPTPPNIPLS
jgi:prepilin-type N-terminal cleavage/methylation domain-containing protein